MYRPAPLLHLLGATDRVCLVQIIHSYRQNTSLARVDGVRGQREKNTHGGHVGGAVDGNLAGEGSPNWGL